MNPKLLMDYKEYAKHDWVYPYSYELNSGDQYLFYFGANHSHDPNNKQYPKLLKFWKKFITKTKEKKVLILVESIPQQPDISPKQGVLNATEQGFITYHAAQEKIKLLCPEPSFRRQVNYLLKQFTKEQIAYHYFARMVDQWHRYQNKPGFERYIETSLQLDKKRFGWKNFNFSLENLKKIHQKLYKTKFNHKDKAFFRDISNPIENTIANKVSDALGKIRDLHILNEIEKHWRKGYNLFIVYGGGHAIVQRKVVEEITGTKHSRISH
jgi:hypothetical protein